MTSRTRLAGFAIVGGLAVTLAGATALAAGPRDLTIAVTTLPVHLDPAHINANVNFRFTQNVLENLITYNEETGRFDPGLATEWKMVEPTVMELKLRDGVTCHNGEAFTAEDVAVMFGPDRLLDPESPANKVGKEQFLPTLSKVEAVDDTTVRITTDTPDPLLALRLSTSVATVPCADAYRAAESWEKWGMAVVGTGPYKVDEIKPGESHRFVAFEDYWGDKAPLSSFTFTVVPEMGARIAGLIAGDYRIATEITPDQFRTISDSGVAHVDGGPVNNIRMIVYDQNHPAMTDPRVRRAMNLAIDRQLIIDTIFDGRTEIPHGPQMASFGDMYIADHQPVRYDPDLARKLLEEAGYAGEEISYRYRTDYYTGEVTTAQVLQQMWKDVGLNVRLELKENWEQIAVPEGRGIINYSATAVFPDPVGQLHRLFGPNGPFQNYRIWANSRFNEWGEALLSPDMEKRRGAITRMLEIYESDAPSTYLHILPEFYGVSDAVQWTPDRTHFMDFRAGKIDFAS